MIQNEYDFVITGAGPVGLAAAISAGRLGAKCIVLEKGNRPGPEPRGESIASYPFIEELLGKDWLKNNSSNDPSYRRFHSPMDRKNHLIDVHKPYYFFHWDDLMDHMKSLALEVGAEFIFEAEVLSSIDKNDKCIGVKYKKDNIEKEVYGHTVLGCMGHKDPLGNKSGIIRESIDCPTIKYRSSNAPNVDIKKHPYLQFYIIPPRTLKSHPNLPPAVAYVFPLKNGEMEAGLMLRLTTIPILKDIIIPNNEEMLEVWDELVENYPGFSSFFKEAETSYKKCTVISNRALIERVIPNENGGLILLGDTIGFSEANGSSGLYFGMAQADFWVKNTFNEINNEKFEWSIKNIENLMFKYRRWDVYKYIKKSYKDLLLAEKVMFKYLGSDKKLNLFWKSFMALMQKAS